MKTRESFDNYFNDINPELFNLYPEKFEEYLKKEWSDKVKFHEKVNHLSNYPLTLVSTKDNLNQQYLNKLTKKNCYWYIKKKTGSYGRSITITKNPISFFGSLIRTMDINNYIIQKEIISDDFEGRKYDYRIYLLIIKRNNKIEYYFYNEYVIRFCYKKIDNDKRDIYNSITNHHIYSLQKLDKNFYCFNKEFKKNHYEKIESLNKSFIDIFSKYEKDFIDLINENEYRILGMDYMVEKDTNKLFILELNTIPGVYYPDVEEDFFIRYNNFHKKLVVELNNLINYGKSDKWLKIS